MPVTLHTTTYISIMVNKNHKLNAKYVLLFHQFINAIDQPQNTSVLYAAMHYIYGKTVKIVQFINVTMTIVLNTSLIKRNLTFVNVYFNLLNLPNLNCVTNSVSIISQTNNFHILHHSHTTI